MCIGYIYVSKPVYLISIMFSISANISPYCLFFVKRSCSIHHKHQYVFHYDLLKGKYNCSAMTGEVLYWPWEGLMLFERCTTYSKKYGSQRKHLPLFQQKKLCDRGFKSFRYFNWCKDPLDARSSKVQYYIPMSKDFFVFWNFTRGINLT